MVVISRMILMESDHIDIFKIYLIVRSITIVLITGPRSHTHVVWDMDGSWHKVSENKMQRKYSFGRHQHCDVTMFLLSISFNTVSRNPYWWRIWRCRPSYIESYLCVCIRMVCGREYRPHKYWEIWCVFPDRSWDSCCIPRLWHSIWILCEY